jgi:DNA-binding response OmpR family regulator
MNYYILQNEQRPVDPDLVSGLKQCGEEVIPLALPRQLSDIKDLLQQQPPGVVCLPVEWEDLYGVKLIQHCGRVGRVVTLMAGAVPESLGDLVVAYNEGLTAFLRKPWTVEELSCLVRRLDDRLEEVCLRDRLRQRMREYERRMTHPSSSPELMMRDRFLARAFLEVRRNEGPLVEGGERVLIVTTSDAQRARLHSYLELGGLDVVDAGTCEQALERIKQQRFVAVVSDNLLPDGEAVELAEQMRKILKDSIPRFVVWTASPDKVDELMNPDYHIDDVILKPNLDAGMETIYLSIVVGLYQTRG